MTAAKRVVWKDEGGVGPLFVIDVARYDAWMAANTTPGQIGIPYGSTPDGLQDYGWQLIEVARSTAAILGVPLEVN